MYTLGPTRFGDHDRVHEQQTVPRTSLKYLGEEVSLNSVLSGHETSGFLAAKTEEPIRCLNRMIW